LIITQESERRSTRRNTTQDGHPKPETARTAGSAGANGVLQMEFLCYLANNSNNSSCWIVAIWENITNSMLLFDIYHNNNKSLITFVLLLRLISNLNKLMFICCDLYK